MGKNDLFRWTLVVSVIFHLIAVLGISFVMPAQAERPVIGPPLKITLVTNISDLAPEESDVVAQANSLGEDEASAELPNAALLTTIQHNNPEQKSAESSDHILSDTAENSDLSNSKSVPKNQSNQEEISREELAENINLAYLNSQSRPREKYVSAKTKESKYAAYLEKWRLLVERVGNLNYPDAAKQQKLEGSLVLDATINSDGSLGKVRILSSSGINILDDAAKRIVHIAAPFDSFPNEILAEVDTLHIVRTWEFSHNKLTSKNLQTN